MSASGRKNNLLVAGLIIVIASGIFLIRSGDANLTDSLDVMEFDEQAILERAYEDVRDSEEFPQLEDEQIIKVFDEDNKLIQSMTLLAGDEIIDEDFRQLVNQSTLLAEYSGSKVYKLTK